VILTNIEVRKNRLKHSPAELINDMKLRIAYRRPLSAKVREKVANVAERAYPRLARLWSSRVRDCKPTIPVEWEHSGQKIDVAPFVFSSNSGVVLYQGGVFTRITERASYGVTVDKAGALLLEELVGVSRSVGVNRWTYARVIRKLGTNAASVPIVRFLHRAAHQIDIVDGRLAIVETRLNTISLFELSSGQLVRQVLPAGKPMNGASANYKHFNSIYADGSNIYLIASNNLVTRGRFSEIFKLDRDWQVIAVITTSSGHAHNVYVEDGVIWHCNSSDGELVVGSDVAFKTDRYMPRGLANNGHHILVGGSQNTRPASARTTGYGGIIVLDASFTPICHFHFPNVGCVMEVRFLQNDRCISRSFGSHI